MEENNTHELSTITEEGLNSVESTIHKEVNLGKPKKKTNKKIIIMIVITLVVLLAGVLIYFLFIDKKEDESKVTTTTTTGVKTGIFEAEDEQVEAMKKAIKFYETKNLSRTIDKLYRVEYFKLEDPDLRLYLTLLNTDTYTNKDNGTEIKTLDDKPKNLSQNGLSMINNKIDYSYVPEESVKNLYNEMFKDEYTEGRDSGLTASGAECPSFAYDSLNKTYLRFEACGGETNVYEASYVYKTEKEITSTSELYYAYVAVGYNEIDFGDYENIMTHYSFIDYNKAEKAAIFELVINESNYQKFDKFKYVFVKDKKTNKVFVDHIEIVK